MDHWLIPDELEFSLTGVDVTHQDTLYMGYTGGQPVEVHSLCIHETPPVKNFQYHKTLRGLPMVTYAFKGGTLK